MYGASQQNFHTLYREQHHFNNFDRHSTSLQHLTAVMHNYESRPPLGMRMKNVDDNDYFAVINNPQEHEVDPYPFKMCEKSVRISQISDACAPN